MKKSKNLFNSLIQQIWIPVEQICQRYYNVRLDSKFDLRMGQVENQVQILFAKLLRYAHEFAKCQNC